MRKWPNIAIHPILSPSQLSLIPASILFKSRGPNLPSKSWHLRSKSPKDFPTGSVDKNPPANARDAGSIPSLVRFHMPMSTWPVCQATESVLYSPRAATTKPMCHNYWSLCALKLVLHNKGCHCNEEPVRCTKSNPYWLQLGKAQAKQQRPRTVINK